MTKKKHNEKDKKDKTQNETNGGTSRRMGEKIRVRRRRITMRTIL